MTVDAPVVCYSCWEQMEPTIDMVGCLGDQVGALARMKEKGYVVERPAKGMLYGVPYVSLCSDCEEEMHPRHLAAVVQKYGGIVGRR